jgi:hypothetical protein
MSAELSARTCIVPDCPNPTAPDSLQCRAMSVRSDRNTVRHSRTTNNGAVVAPAGSQAAQRTPGGLPRDSQAERDAVVAAGWGSEAQIQQEIRRALLIAGWRVWRVGQRNAKGTQDAGVSDLIAMKPGLGVVFVEVKAPSGRQSAAQRWFEAVCRAAGGRYLLARSVDDVLELLNAPSES